ncbi:MAG: OsmC family protein [Acidobacteria bacterium]|nr:OsmC family protein [Acidobacteriota bacterium]MBI3489298.1 OsmC family protein [Acidobacteriota bacterium]
MGIHTATIEWQRHAQPFLDNRYSRVHRWRFDGGAEVPASSSPHVVRVPFSDPSCVDPEEAYVAALSSCHMLWFLSIAASRGYCVDRYVDQAEGLMARGENGKEWIIRVTLAPQVVFSGTGVPTDEVVANLHHEAHKECFLAQSVRSDIQIVPTWEYQATN